MSIKCVFYIEEVTKVGGTGMTRIKARAAAKGPYADYSKYTPVGSLTFDTLNENAGEWIEKFNGGDVVLELREPTEADLITPPFKG